MSKAIDTAIKSLTEELEIYLKKIAEIKKAINHLCVMNNENPIYTDIDTISNSGIVNIRPDQ